MASSIEDSVETERSSSLQNNTISSKSTTQSSYGDQQDGSSYDQIGSYKHKYTLQAIIYSIIIICISFIFFIPTIPTTHIDICSNIFYIVV